MQKHRKYFPVIFSADVVQQFESAYIAILPEGERTSYHPTREVGTRRELWRFDSADEFYAAYRKGFDEVFLIHAQSGGKTRFKFQVVDEVYVIVEVSATTRAEIERVFAPLDSAETASTVEAPALPRPTIFIGHGRNPMWRDLKDHLHEQHGYDVQAYEIGSRAGHEVRDILEDMLEKSTFACLVLAAEDHTADGKMRARQNVVHELGLFQGVLGFPRAIALVEEGVEDFSNLAGVHQIRFRAGAIRETFGDVLATIRREFGG